MLGGDKQFLTRKTPPDYSGQRPIRVVDLFSGCGGLTLGVGEACRARGRGLSVVLAMEIDENVRAVYDANFRSILRDRRGDVLERFDGSVGAKVTKAEQATRTDVGRVDVLVGGPPCQGHSNLNNHTRRTDPKNSLYMAVVRAAEVLRPRHVLVENVGGVQRDATAVLERAVKRLSEIGYHVDHGMVHLARLGVPQLRVRHLLLASTKPLRELSAVVERNAVGRERTLRWAIGDLGGVERESLVDQVSELSAANLRRARFLIESGRYDLPNSRRPACHRNKPDHRYKSMYGRLAWDAPAQTVTTGFSSPGQGRYLHPDDPRTLTAHEAARLQFLPDWFDFEAARGRRALARCIGNAVPPKLGYVFATELLFGACKGDVVSLSAPRSSSVEASGVASVAASA